MLGVEEHPVEPGGGERPDGVRRPELKTTAAKLHPALFEGLLHRIRAHQAIIHVLSRGQVPRHLRAVGAWHLRE